MAAPIAGIPVHTNPYAILGLEERGAAATEQEIRSAYRRLALLRHPDSWRFRRTTTTPGDDDSNGDAFRQLHDAYRALSNGTSRRAIDIRNAGAPIIFPRLVGGSGARRRTIHDFRSSNRGYRRIMAPGLADTRITDGAMAEGESDLHI